MRDPISFSITASCRYWWWDFSGETNFACGQTRNLGAGGVCVIAEVHPLAGTLVMLEIDLPRPGGQLNDDPLLLRAEGRVLQDGGSEKEFVVMITHATLDRTSRALETERL